jgi:hypothetical protein
MRDEATRLAFRQIAKAWAQLAFGPDFTELDDAPVNSDDVGSAEASEVGARPLVIRSETENRVTSDRKIGDSDWRDRTSRLQRLSLKPRTPFPKR